MKQRNNFPKLLEIYEKFLSVTNNDRRESYELAEEAYEDVHGERLFNDFRIFSARLKMYYTKDMPHSTTSNVRR